MVTSGGGNALCDGAAGNIALYTIKGDMIFNRYICPPSYNAYFFTNNGKIYFSMYSFQDGQQKMYVVDINSGTAPKITLHPLGDLDVRQVSPDGSLLASESLQDGKYYTKVVSFPGLKLLAGMEGKIEFVPSGAGKYTWQAIGQNGLSQTLPCGIDPEYHQVVAKVSEHDVIGLSWYPYFGYIGTPPMTLQLWDTTSCALERTLVYSTAYAPVFSPDGRILAALDPANNRIDFYAVDNGAILFTISNGQAGVRFTQVGFGADSSLAYVVGNQNKDNHDDYDVSIWDVRTGKRLYGLIQSAAGIPRIFSDPRKAVLYVQDQSVLHIWNLETGLLVDTLGGVKDFTVSADGKVLSLLSGDSVKLINLATGTEFRDIPIGGADLKGIFSNRDGSRLVLLSNDGKKTRPLTIDTVDQTETSGANSNHYWLDLANSSTGKYFITFSSEDGLIDLTDYEHPDLAKIFLGFNTDAGITDYGSTYGFNSQSVDFDCVGFSPDDRLLYAVFRNGIRMWDVRTGEMLAEMKPDYSVKNISFSPDGRLLVVTGEDGTIRIWGVKVANQ